MNILIPDSWLREFLKTQAKPEQIAQMMSLCAASVEKVERLKDDFVYHAEITTNRVDMASIYGFAREVVAVLPRFNIEAKLKKEAEQKTALTSKSTVDYLTVKIADPSLCLRFTAILLENVTIKPSPPIIRERLEKCGIRAINNVVDISNYVMLELGQPMHTFDYDKISGQKMLMRLSQKGESIVTLDDTQRKLPEGSIVIEDGKRRIIDLCGIMGGKNSAISENSKRALLFVQTYDSVRIRKSCQKMAFRTDAASLFEKSLDPENVPSALLQAVKLLEETSQAKPAKEVIDIYPAPYKPKTIALDLSTVERIIGIRIPPTDILNILQSLGFNSQFAIRNSQFSVTIPSYRSQDVSIPEDLIEEIARLFGYHNLPPVLPQGEIPQNPKNDSFYWENRVKQALKYWGLTETYNYSMISGDLLEKCGFNPAKTLKIQNPLTDDLVYMQPSLLPSLLSVSAKNQNLQADLLLFEMAHVYLPRKSDLPVEQLRLCGVLAGERFLEAKGIVESLLDDLGIAGYTFSPYTLYPIPYTNFWHPGRTAQIKQQNKDLGLVGEVHPQILEKLEIKNRVTMFDLNFAILASMATKTRKYHPIPKYPPVIEDLAVIANRKVLTADIADAIRSVSHLVKNVTLWDVFQNTRTFRLAYQSANKTLSDKEVGEIRNKIIEVLKKKFSAEIKAANSL